MRGIFNRRVILWATVLVSVAAGTSGQTGGRVMDIDHLTLEDGLPNLRTDAILQDHMGYIWIGTKRGLCRYNGYDFEIYKVKPDDSTSLRYHQISCLYEDTDQDLWVGAWSGGLHVYDREKDHFRRTPIPQIVNSISQDLEGYLWIATETGLFKYDKLRGKTTTYHFWNSDGTRDRNVVEVFHKEGETFVVIDGLGILRYDAGLDDFTMLLLMEDYRRYGINNIHCVFVYNPETFWLGTERGLFRFSPGLEPRLERILDVDQQGVFTDISFIINESYRTIWIGADGLYSYDLIENRFTQYQHDVNKPYSLSSDFVTCGYRDRQGNIWVGTYSSGINIIKNSANNFHRHSVINDQLELQSRNITAIIQDKERNLWLGTWDRGVLVFDEHHRQVEEMNRVYPALQYLAKEHIRVLAEGPDENVWIGSSTEMLTLIDRHNKRSHLYPLPLSDQTWNVQNHVTCLLFESDSLLWIGTSHKGLYLFDVRQKKYLPFDEQRKMNNLNILDMEKDRNGNIWIATYYTGVYRMDQNKNFVHYGFDGIQDESLQDASFITIYRDKKDNLWFGTEFHGLLRMEPDYTTSIIDISTELTKTEITSIQEDNYGRFWIATTEGLIRYEEATGTTRYFSWEDGMFAYDVNYNASYQGDDDIIYLGGTNGLAYFHPGSIRDNLYVPPVYIETLLINNRKVTMEQKGSPLKKPIYLTDSITFRYSQNVTGFEFAALNFLHSNKNQYAYMLEGFDDSGWNELGTTRRMTFTNLNFGHYTLRVKGSNNDGIWNEEGVSLAIRILPPFWLTWWAFVIYGLLSCGLIYLTYRSFRQRLLLRQQIIGQRVEKEHQVKLSNMKLEFFTNISHEFKTPLNLIISPLEEIMRNFKGSNETRHKLQLIQRNSHRLLRLVKLLIDFRKAEQDVLKLNVGRYDLILLARETIQTFESVVISENKHIELRTDMASFMCEFDRDKMERVLYNLLANAVYFTNVLAEITIHIHAGEDNQTIGIDIQDTGVGIDENDLPHIFEKFYQTERSSHGTISTTGSGIGLYLCKKIVELHGGSIQVESAAGKGSIFRMNLPVSNMQMEEKDGRTYEGNKPEAGLVVLESLNDQDPPEVSENAPLILIVEDHIELRDHIRRMLWNCYRIEEAVNGTTGLEKAKSLLPDLVLSDIIMPGMDGVEMCMQIKRDPKTEHIPVILLSAKSDLASKVEGYEKGADDYLEKPFFPQHLQARIKNLIESREKLRMHFGNETHEKPRIAGIKPYDREFLEKLFYKIEQNVGNSEYNVNELSAELGMSRVHLYRRFKDLTGKTPKDYIKETRLKAAAHLLEENHYTVSEVAYRVGFNTPSNFTASFKSFYGISPKEYKSG